MKIQAGKVQTLKIHALEGPTALLGDEDQQVPLNRKEIRKDVAVGDELEVFVYYNEKSELQASLKIPMLQLHEIAGVKIRSVGEFGAFADIGSSRDILIPSREQSTQLAAGMYALITLKEDVVAKRLFGTTRLLKYLRNEEHPYKRGDEVQLTIWEKIDIGRRVIIDGKYNGVLFKQETTRPVRQGDKVVGYIRKIEGKDIQVSMQKEGMELIEDAIAKLVDFLTINGGYARINDDTTPEEIQLRLRMSKKTFKRAAGVLLKKELIEFTKFGIKLKTKPPQPAPTKFKPKPFKPKPRPSAETGD
jgi:uncharacterized protein